MHTFVPPDIINSGIDEKQSEYIKYNGVLCSVRRIDDYRVVERIISTNPKDYLTHNVVGKKILK